MAHLLLLGLFAAYGFGHCPSSVAEAFVLLVILEP